MAKKPGKKQDRISIDLQDLRPVVEDFRHDNAWKQLSLAAKIRALLKDSTAISKESAAEPTTISQIVDEEWAAVMDSDLDLSLLRLKAIRSGEKPSEEEIIVLATVLSRDAHELMEIKRKTFPCNGEKLNGQPAERV